MSALRENPDGPFYAVADGPFYGPAADGYSYNYLEPSQIGAIVADGYSYLEPSQIGAIVAAYAALFLGRFVWTRRSGPLLPVHVHGEMLPVHVHREMLPVHGEKSAVSTVSGPLFLGPASSQSAPAKTTIVPPPRSKTRRAAVPDVDATDSDRIDSNVSAGRDDATMPVATGLAMPVAAGLAMPVAAGLAMPNALPGGIDSLPGGT
ncbi:hypothetical protein PLICRDRAFT_32019 [Plicaturopsis crispa FD-325 SS-3]|uniref:Uncharacterized protein n=1 Tax=Plicaturopsis crispa FD-325 SS-3 TaxID=944288 RepID=A0A0C9SS53_PLICR|nr:hypothetical protein PLICRDRAFT_32019 [Plicaturopsis crispa FD-325 SS-3]